MNEKSIQQGAFLDCKRALGDEVIYSNIPKLKPQVTATMDISCLLYLSAFRFFKWTWTESPTRKRVIMNWIFGITVTICIADSIWNAITFEYALINNILRPLVVILFFSSIRSNLLLIWHDFQDSFIILISIFVFILFFSSLGLFIF